mmetsp:Transcript_19928/g.36037  ORF Transcript_19928/g.36037 Transcript_19928/m.36037 type:complete len:80 (+) Transcript_19928:274-513(+)
MATDFAYAPRLPLRRAFRIGICAKVASPFGFLLGTGGLAVLTRMVLLLFSFLASAIDDLLEVGIEATSDRPNLLLLALA